MNVADGLLKALQAFSIACSQSILCFSSTTTHPNCYCRCRRCEGTHYRSPESPLTAILAQPSGVLNQSRNDVVKRQDAC
jgi:hypothetical protein